MINSPSSSSVERTPQVPELNSVFREESAENFAKLAKKEEFMRAVNTLLWRSYNQQEWTDMRSYFNRDGTKIEWRTFPSNHQFYQDVYDYMKKNNPTLLVESMNSSWPHPQRGVGVTWSQVAGFMINSANKSRSSPWKKTVAQHTHQNLTHLQQVVSEGIPWDTDAEKKMLPLISDFEQTLDSFVDNPTTFNDSWKQIDTIKQEVMDVSNNSTENQKFWDFVERQLQKFLLDRLINKGVIPYLDWGVVKFQTTEGYTWTWKNPWSSQTSITQQSLEYYMIYTAERQSPDDTINIIKGKMGSFPSTPYNIVNNTNIPNRWKPLALSAIWQLSWNNQTMWLAQADAALYSQYGIQDCSYILADGVSYVDKMRKRGKWLPDWSDKKGIGEFMQSPVKEAFERGWALEGFIMIGGIATATWLFWTKMFAQRFAGKDKEPWAWEKFFGMLTAFWVGAVWLHLGWDAVKNSPLESVDPNRREKAREKFWQDNFRKTEDDFQKDVLDPLFLFHDTLDKDDQDRSFVEYTSAEDFFNVSGKWFLNETPKEVDKITPWSLTVELPKTKWQTRLSDEQLKQYKVLYKLIHNKYQSASSQPSPVVNGTSISIQQFIAELYKKP